MKNVQRENCLGDPVVPFNLFAHLRPTSKKSHHYALDQPAHSSDRAADHNPANTLARAVVITGLVHRKKTKGGELRTSRHLIK